RSLPMRPPPPRATLVPYTTLFRSPRRAGVRPPHDGDREPTGVLERVAGGDLLELRGDARVRLARDRAGARRHHRERDMWDRVHPDRKSTRLNSSHVKISYAVFCLI